MGGWAMFLFAHDTLLSFPPVPSESKEMLKSK
jgi:hypothetical protein